MTTSHTGASPRLLSSKRLAALLLLPLALLLSACHVSSAVTVTAAGGVIADIEISGDKSSMNLSSVSCAAYGTYWRGFSGDLTFEDLTQDETTDVLCRIHGYAENGVDGKILIDNDSTYILRIPVEAILKDYATEHSSDTYYLVVHMPGDVVSASEGGKISGSDVVFEGKVSELDGDIEVEASKTDSSPAFLWVLGLLVVLLVAAIFASRYLRKKDLSQIPFLAKLFGKKEDNDAGKSQGTPAKKSKSSDSIAVSTTDSTIALAPLPDKYAPKNVDGTSESYSEQIGMVDPIIQGSAADAVKRDIVLPEIPPETAFTSPIEGMPPRIPMPDELFAAFSEERSDRAVPNLPEVPEALPVEPDGLDGGGVDSEFDDGEDESESAADAFFSQFLDVTEDEDIDEETDL
ncbi:MAG: hypothetical protein IKS49_01895 [Actinomycetaceae bacterium]|nr:hypothetical protein [Actinomycetaceae bacterium]